MNNNLFETLASEFHDFMAANQSMFFSVLATSSLSEEEKANALLAQNHNVLELLVKTSSIIGFEVGKKTVKTSNPVGNIVMPDVASASDAPVIRSESLPLTRTNLFGKQAKEPPKNRRDPVKEPPLLKPGYFYVRYKDSAGDDIYKLFADESIAIAFAKLIEGVWGQL